MEKKPIERNLFQSNEGSDSLFSTNKNLNLENLIYNEELLTKILTKNFDRRTLIKIFGATFFGSSLLSNISCSKCSDPHLRGFYIKNVFKWLSIGTYIDLAFKVLNPHRKSLMDYLDIRCSKCSSFFRFFLYAVDIIGTGVNIFCPYCSVPARTTMVVSSLLYNKLISNIFKSGLALLHGNGYFIHKIAPSYLHGGLVDVKRSSVCYDIQGREPIGYFNREIPAIPRKINYFTNVVGMRKKTTIYHTWIKNGRITDKIPLIVDSHNWRTWSRKRNLDVGTWIVMTETGSGKILDAKEFFIAG